MFWGPPEKKGFPLVSVFLSELVKAVTVAWMHNLFTGLFETGFQDKQGKYVKPLLIEHLKSFAL